MILTKFFKGMEPRHITQGFHSGHPGLDIIGNGTNFGYGTPLCAPENVRIDSIRGDTFTPDDNQNLGRGYGIAMTGLETGMKYLYWHCLPTFPVWGGQIVNRGQIVAYMGNAGIVARGGSLVPVSDRLDYGMPGTHLHIEITKGVDKVDPAPLINWAWNPTYSMFDFIRGMLAVLQKTSKLIGGTF